MFNIQTHMVSWRGICCAVPNALTASYCRTSRAKQEPKRSLARLSLFSASWDSSSAPLSSSSRRPSTFWRPASLWLFWSRSLHSHSTARNRWTGKSLAATDPLMATARRPNRNKSAQLHAGCVHTNLIWINSKLLFKENLNNFIFANRTGWAFTVQTSWTHSGDFSRKIFNRRKMLTSRAVALGRVVSNGLKAKLSGGHRVMPVRNSHEWVSDPNRLLFTKRWRIGKIWFSWYQPDPLGQLMIDTIKLATEHSRN